MTETRPLLEARQVFKGFFGNPVLKGVDIALHPGRVHALLGENGAGKSTLINLLSGALQPDSGAILVEGRPVGRFSPAAARGAGIAVVQQELSLTADLSIAENIGLGAFPRRFGLIDYAALHRGVREVCDMVGLTEPLDMPVADLALGRRQMVEIAKALFRKPRVLILDEPTSSLSAHEAGILARLIETLRDRGTALLYISHRLNEVQALCTHVTVLKDGGVTADQSLAGIGGEGLVRLMVGREVSNVFPKTPAAIGKTVLAVRGIGDGDRFHDISFDVRAGEILGLTGLVGAGRTEVARAIFGLAPFTTGTVEIDGVPVNIGSPAAAARVGIAYVPEDRKGDGIVPAMTVRENISLPVLRRLANGFGRVRRGDERELAGTYVKKFSIVPPDGERRIGLLSGGNQQKAVISRWLATDPKVLILDEPTRGVDVGAKAEIHGIIGQLVANGMAVVMISSELPEIMGVCDRVVVMRDGRASMPIAREGLSEERIMALATGEESAEGEAA